MGLCNSSYSFRGYVYIPKDEVESVKKHGLLSARKLADLLPSSHTTLVEKYKEQKNSALEKFKDELEEYIKEHSDGTDIGDILAYLDWREEKTLNGSNAIYFLFAPVPHHATILRHIKKYRDNFLEGRVLVSFPITVRNASAVHIISEGDDSLELGDVFGKDEKYWVDIWKDAIKYDKEHPDEPPLWFSGIPHAFIIPKTGLIPPEQLTFHTE